VNWRRYIIFLPSISLGFIAAIWLYFKPAPYETKFGAMGLSLIAILLIIILLGGAQLLENTLPSFKEASKLLERALARFTITLPLAFGLALLSSVSEELFFRGALMPVIGAWGQAVVFALMHPCHTCSLHY